MDCQKPFKILCLAPQHDSKPIRFMCMKEDCDLPSRLGCFDCIKFQHSAHYADFIDYKDIFIRNESKMYHTTYPDDQTSKDYKLFINDHGQPLTNELINEQIDGLKKQFLDRIEQIRAELLNKVTIQQNLSIAHKEEAKQIFNSVFYLYQQFQQAYTLNPLKQILIQFNQNKNNSQMNHNIKQFIMNNERKSQITLLQEKLKIFIKALDTKYMSKVYEHCSQQIICFTDLLKLCIQSNDQQQIINNNIFKLEQPGSLIFVNSNGNNKNENNKILQQDTNINLKFEEWRFMIQKVDQILKSDLKEEKQNLYESILQFTNVEEMKNIIISTATIKYPQLQFQQKIQKIEDQIWKITIEKESILINYSHWQLLQTYLVRKVKSIRLLFRATRDGMNGQSFHSKCDKKGPTITIIQSKNYERIFGGFANVDWVSQHSWVADQERKGFLFSLTHQTKHEMINGKQSYAIYCNPSYGPDFGGGFVKPDICISNEFGMESYSNLGATYIPIVGAYQSTEAKSHLAGAHYFAVKEMEVFQVEFQ